MVIRLAVALILGAILGVERELVGKEAGARTEIVVAGGSALFAMIALSLPYITASVSGNVPDLMARDSAFGVIANIVVGIGFLGAGLIIKTNDHPHGLTTAALVWTTAAIGILAGIGMIQLAAFSATIITLLLYVLRKLNISEKIGAYSGKNQ